MIKISKSKIKNKIENKVIFQQKCKLKLKILNLLIINGNKLTSEKSFLRSVKSIQKSHLKDHKNLIKLAIINTSPLIFIKQTNMKRKQQRVKEFPFILSNQKRISVAIKSILNFTENKSKTKFFKRFFNEILNASNNNGENIKKKKKLYEYAFVKKKYAHYRWF